MARRSSKKSGSSGSLAILAILAFLAIILLIVYLVKSDHQADKVIVVTPSAAPDDTQILKKQPARAPSGNVVKGCSQLHCTAGNQCIDSCGVCQSVNGCVCPNGSRVARTDKC